MLERRTLLRGRILEMLLDVNSGRNGLIVAAALFSVQSPNCRAGAPMALVPGMCLPRRDWPYIHIPFN